MRVAPGCGDPSMAVTGPSSLEILSCPRHRNPGIFRRVGLLDVVRDLPTYHIGDMLGVMECEVIQQGDDLPAEEAR